MKSVSVYRMLVWASSRRAALALFPQATKHKPRNTSGNRIWGWRIRASPDKAVKLNILHWDTETVVAGGCKLQVAGCKFPHLTNARSRRKRNHRQSIIATSLGVDQWLRKAEMERGWRMGRRREDGAGSDQRQPQNHVAPCTAAVPGRPILGRPILHKNATYGLPYLNT